MIPKKCAWILLIVTFFPLFSKKIIQNQLVATSKELVHGHQFVHTYQVIDGIKRQAWAIDGQAVDKAAYEEAILDAEKAERRLEREEMYAAQEEELAAQQRMQQAVLKKLLGISLNNLKGQMRRIEEYHLQPYIAYGPEGLTQEQYEALNQFFSQAQVLMQEAEPALSELQSLLDRGEWYEKQMKKLVRDSIAQAIAKCDDTAMLKRLLEISA